MEKVFDFMDEDRKVYLEIKHKEVAPYIDPNTGKIYEEMVKNVDCPVCDLDDSINVFQKDGFNFVKCKHCGLLYVNPQLKVDLLDSIYKKSRTATQWIKIQTSEKERKWNNRFKYIPALEELRKSYPQGGKLLDVGCSVGQFLEVSKGYNWDGVGVELNAEAAEYTETNYGITVYRDKIEEIDFEENSFDLITLWGVFEHLSEPNEMLKTCNKLLKKSGLLLLFVPNGHSLIIRLSRNYNSTVSGRAHLWYFSPLTINNMLQKNGFEKVSEFTTLPQIHEIVHFLQYNELYKESEMLTEEEFEIDESIKSLLEKYINTNKLGYKMITIASKV